MNPGDLAPYGALPVPRLTTDLLSLVKTGMVYSLSVVYGEGIPVPEPMVPYTLTPRLRHGDLKGIAPASAAAEAITMSAHTGTHIDALCHIGEADADGTVRLFGGVCASEQVDYHGQKYLSIAEMPPILTRAVLLDVAASKGVEVLPDAYVISADDVDQALARQSTTVMPGSAVLIRTGFYRHLASGNPAYKNSIAGIGLEAAQALHARGMTLIGADNMTVEAFPPYDHSVHRYLLVHNGVTHLENLYLEELSAQGVYEFLLIVTPLRLQGATGSWVHPIAIA